MVSISTLLFKAVLSHFLLSHPRDKCSAALLESKSDGVLVSAAVPDFSLR